MNKKSLIIAILLVFVVIVSSSAVFAENSAIDDQLQQDDNIAEISQTNDDELLSEGTPEEQLHILFNIIEIEIKIRKKDEKDLKLLYNKLCEKKLNKNFEDYIHILNFFFVLTKMLINLLMISLQILTKINLRFIPI